MEIRKNKDIIPQPFAQCHDGEGVLMCKSLLDGFDSEKFPFMHADTMPAGVSIGLHRHDGNEEIYLASADWMPRNLDRRVELMFPVTEGALKKRLRNALQIQWSDNTKAREMKPDGSYRLLYREEEEHINAQEELMKGADLD